MEERSCKNCKYFRQHYSLSKLGFVEIEEGHCMMRLRLKKFVPCENYKFVETKNLIEERKRERCEIVLQQVNDKLKVISDWIERGV